MKHLVHDIEKGDSLDMMKPEELPESLRNHIGGLVTTSSFWTAKAPSRIARRALSVLTGTGVTLGHGTSWTWAEERGMVWQFAPDPRQQATTAGRDGPRRNCRPKAIGRVQQRPLADVAITWYAPNAMPAENPPGCLLFSRSTGRSPSGCAASILGELGNRKHADGGDLEREGFTVVCEELVATAWGRSGVSWRYRQSGTEKMKPKR